MTLILVVDDEPPVRAYVKKVLSRDGFDILEAPDGASAISITREFGRNIAALVTDVEMNGVSGTALATTITREFPNIPVLFMTAKVISEEDLRRDVPNCVLLQKPFNPRELILMLRNLLAAGEGKPSNP
jgi:DNA-binding response OmpR family regulator